MNLGYECISRHSYSMHKIARPPPWQGRWRSGALGRWPRRVRSWLTNVHGGKLSWRQRDPWKELVLYVRGRKRSTAGGRVWRDVLRAWFSGCGCCKRQEFGRTTEICRRGVLRGGQGFFAEAGKMSWSAFVSSGVGHGEFRGHRRHVYRRRRVCMRVQVGSAWSTDHVPESVFADVGSDLDHLRRAVLLVFEHTERYGTGALVVNRATPVTVGELRIARFNGFRGNRMYQGGPIGQGSDLVLGDQGPWYWIHNDGDTEGTRNLSGEIYMGGQVDRSEALVSKPQRVKFFWRHCYFPPGQFEDLIGRDLLTEIPCTADTVLFDKADRGRPPKMSNTETRDL